MDNTYLAALGASAAWLSILAVWLKWSVTNAVKVILADFRDALRAEFSSRFQDSKLAEAKIEPIVKEVATLHSRMNEVEAYAHEWRHAHANAIQRMLIRSGNEDPTIKL